MLNRRKLLTSAIPAAAGFALLRCSAIASDTSTRKFEQEVALLEKKSGGRLGVSVLDQKSGALIGHRLNERFPMCSTFKLMAAAAILRRADERHEQLDRVVHYTKADLLAHSPITEQHLATGMALRDICEAAVTDSDNCAANQMLAALGGPAGVTAFARALGDRMTRLDRTELSLDTAIPGDPRDTTTPAATAHNLRALVFGDALQPASRDLLIRWMRACTTGSARLHAGLPADWVEGDKTGTGNTGTGTANDIAVLWPPSRPPIVAAVYLTQSKLDADGQNAVLADVGRLIATHFSA